jgi:hypothetical protein
VLALYVGGATAYFFEFASVGDLARGPSGTMLLKNVSIIGGLLIVFVIGSWQQGEIEDVQEDYAHETHA